MNGEKMLDELRRLSQNFLKTKNSSYKRYFIKNNTFTHRLSLLLGQRGVGKTTTLIQFLLDKCSQDVYSSTILYVQADHFLVGNSSLYEIADEFQAMGGKYIAFDEIHKYANWSQELKSIYDTFPSLTVVASGSSALQVHKGSHDLSRRAIKYTMEGLSFREFLELSFNIELEPFLLPHVLENHVPIAHAIIDAVGALGQKILPLFQTYLSYGYYPYFFELPKKELYYITLEQNLHSTIENDLAAIYPYLNNTSISKLKQLLIFIAKSVPFTPNWTEIKNLLEIGDIRTVKTYFQYLEDASLVRTIGKMNKKLSHIGNVEKVYLDNPNQMRALTMGNQNIGNEREIFFLDMVALDHTVTLHRQADFFVNEKYIFEVGGRKKSFEQIAGEQNAYLACDDIESGSGSKIPLWLFGFLY